MAGLCFYVVKFACMSSILLNKIHKPASKETWHARNPIFSILIPSYHGNWVMNYFICLQSEFPEEGVQNADSSVQFNVQFSSGLS